jgi:hypothetical protein
MESLMKSLLRIVLAGAATAAVVPLTHAHFKLLEPAASLLTDDRGDPQKLAPCGGTSDDAGTPSGAVTPVQGGQPLLLRIQETIFHPGHYRVALAVVSRDELPPEPEAVMQETERGPRSHSAPIQDPPQIPVLADGLLPRTSPPTELLETYVDLPNINCERCTLQVIQFMLNHPGTREGNFAYYHCADLAITADPAKPIDTRWPEQS